MKIIFEYSVVVIIFLLVISPFIFQGCKTEKDIDHKISNGWTLRL